MGNLNLPQVAAAQNQKEVTINAATDQLDKALTATLTLDLSAADVVLTAAQYQSAMVFTTTGNAVARILTLPAIARQVSVINAGTAALAVTVGTTTLAVAAGTSAIVATDGTANGLKALGGAGGGGGGGGSGAAPTAKVGLLPITGVASTWMASDSAPALDVSIAPTWTGLHKFNAGLTATTGAFSGKLTAALAPAAATDVVRLSDLPAAPVIPVVANPAGLIGLAAVNGVANTWERSDSAHALDVSIAPTWTGQHTFSNAVAPLTVTAGPTSLQALSATNVSITGTASRLQIGSTAGSWATSQYAIDIGAAGAIRADAVDAIALASNVYIGSDGGPAETKQAGYGAEFKVSGGAFTWSTTTLGTARGNWVTKSDVMALSNTGALSLFGAGSLVQAGQGSLNSGSKWGWAGPFSLAEIGFSHIGGQVADTRLGFNCYYDGSTYRGKAAYPAAMEFILNPWTGFAWYVSTAAVTNGAALTMAPKMVLSPAGALTVNGAAVSSDARLKKNIATIPRALDFIHSLNGVRFDWIDNDAPNLGLIAQDVERTYPELVLEGPGKGQKSLNYNGIVACLVEAVKEQQTQIDTLKAKIH